MFTLRAIPPARAKIVDQELSVVGRGTSPSAMRPHTSVLPKEKCEGAISAPPPPSPSLPAVHRKLMYLFYSQSDNHNGTQVPYKAATGMSWTSSKHRQLGRARPAVGKRVSMRHCVMAFGTEGGGAAGGLSQCSSQRVQSDPQRAHHLHAVLTVSSRARHVVR